MTPSLSVTAKPRPVLDTRERFDAHALGYDGPADPHSDGHGLIVYRDSFPSITLVGPEGQVELRGAPELRAVMAEIARALAGIEASKRKAA